MTAVLVNAILVASAFGFLVPASDAIAISCGDVITKSTKLTFGLETCSDNGLSIGADHVTLDCAGHMISGPGSKQGSGIIINGRSDVKVINCRTFGFKYGFQVIASNSVNLTGNIANHSVNDGYNMKTRTTGITIFNNTATGNGDAGYHLEDGTSLNNLTNNVSVGNNLDQGNHHGFWLLKSNGNSLTGNIAKHNVGQGFNIDDSANNLLLYNYASDNTLNGFALVGDSSFSKQNLLARNTAIANIQNGFFASGGSSQNTFQLNLANGNFHFGYVDRSTGLGNFGTGNTYFNDYCNVNGIARSVPNGICRESVSTRSLIPPGKVDSHGPRIEQIDFSVIQNEQTLNKSVVSGAIQVPEWPLGATSWTSLVDKSSVVRGSQIGYTFDGVGFNTLKPYMNNVHYRRAIQYLTDYNYIKRNIFLGIRGSMVGSYVLPCRVYPAACYQGPVRFSFNIVSAATEMLRAGLVASLAGRLVCLGTASGCVDRILVTRQNVSMITAWYRHQNPDPGTSTLGSDCSTAPGAWSASTRSACLFRPKLYYVNDDPLRTRIALSLISTALRIGFTFDAIPISQAASTQIFDQSASAVRSRGVYNPTTGYNDPAPTFEPTAVNATDVNSVPDLWDMYTFSWVGSPKYDLQGRIFNSAFSGSYNFLNYHNSTMDYYSNRLLFASTSKDAMTAARQVGRIAAQQVPVVMSFFRFNLWAGNIDQFRGYANVRSTGPTTMGGLYYSLLNLHPRITQEGGTVGLGLHAVANKSGLNPLYPYAWVWQSDIWGEIYDSPLATSPANFRVVNSYVNYMTSKFSFNTFTGKTGTGPGWFNTQSGVAHSSARIVNGINISLTFRDNVTWSDHVPVTALDYNFSLYAWDLAAPPNLPNELTPFTGLLSGSAGLWATHVVGNRIDIFVNSSSIWTLSRVIVPVLPEHILRYFNMDMFATKHGAVDTTLPYETIRGNPATGAVGTCPDALCSKGPAPEWLQYLPRLEIGSGPFVLDSYNGATGAGTLVANVNYMRAAWAVNATIHSLPVGTGSVKVGGKGADIIISKLFERIYNPTPSTFLGVLPFSQGVVNIPGSNVTSATYTVLKDGKGNVLASGNLKCDSLAVCRATIPIGTLTEGNYEIIIKVNYSFLGLARVWYQATGFSLN